MGCIGAVVGRGLGLAPANQGREVEVRSPVAL